MFNQSKVVKVKEGMKSEQNSVETLCCVCYRAVKFYSIGECNHPVCFQCSTRMRILCSSTECAICRKDMVSVIFSTKSLPYANYNYKNFNYDRKYSIYFETEQVMSYYDKLLEHVCKECKKFTQFEKFCHLERHMIEVHELYYCHLCVNNLKCFTYERKYYQMNLLKIHRSKGDADDKSHKGHPLCEYCNERYMDKDELFLHLRRKHYHCHFCDADGLQQFFNDYSHLRVHFKNNHFLCEKENCIDERFTSVFRSDVDLKAHWSQTHAHNVSKQEARQGRVIETEFNVFWRTNSDRNRRTGGNNRMTTTTRTEQDLEDQATAAAALPPSRSSQKPVDIRCVENFPTLGGKKAPMTDMSKKSSNKSIAQKFAEQNRFSVKSDNHSYTQEDFPSLGPVVSVNANLPMASVQLNVNRNSNVANKQRVETINRPQISSITHSSNISLEASSGTKPKPSQEDFPSLVASYRCEKPTWVNTSKNNNNGLNKPKPAKVEKVKPKKPVFDEINDFPSLGNSSGNLQQVLNYSGKSSVTVPMKKATVPVKRVTTAPTIPIANNGIKNIRQIPTKNDAIGVRKNKNKVNLSNIFSDPFNPNEPKEDLTMTRLGDYESISDRRAPNVSLVRQEDLIKNNPKTENVAAPKFKKGDFPSLGLQSDVFQDLNSNWRTTPKRKTNIKETNVLEEDFSESNAESLNSTQEFILPPGFNDRNISLIGTIRNLSNPTKFDKFKNLAGQLRNGDIDYKVYYNQCKKIIGKDNFLVVFPELLALLPDINMQQGILKEFRSNDGTKGVQMQFAICSTCQQVLLPEDFSTHAQSHIFQSINK